MDYPLNLPGFEANQVMVRTAGAFSGPKILVDGMPLKPVKRKYVVEDNAGREVTLQFKPVIFDTVPRIDVNGTLVELVPRLHPAAYFVACLPIFLIFVGGALGGLFGGAAVYLNLAIFRSAMPEPVKYLLALAVGGAAFGCFFLLAVLIQLGIAGAR